MSDKPKVVCVKCGQPPVKVSGTEPLVDGLCFYCRMRIRMGKERR